mmetsp:Transcript_80460/g.232456  ORF Transcript_80460/g.232456 Transcript_80460/m.232456 type:complete len:272 (+) Transcript_80460:1183-1998(+)
MLGRDVLQNLIENRLNFDEAHQADNADHADKPERPPGASQARAAFRPCHPVAADDGHVESQPCPHVALGGLLRVEDLHSFGMVASEEGQHDVGGPVGEREPEDDMHRFGLGHVGEAQLQRDVDQVVHDEEHAGDVPEQAELRSGPDHEAASGGQRLRAPVLVFRELGRADGHGRVLPHHGAVREERLEDEGLRCTVPHGGTARARHRRGRGLRRFGHRRIGLCQHYRRRLAGARGHVAGGRGGALRQLRLAHRGVGAERLQRREGRLVGAE